MSLKFKGTNNEQFFLDTISFAVLDRNNLFDIYQINSNINSDMILEVAEKDIDKLIKDILDFMSINPKIRFDTQIHINEFCRWLKRCKGFKTYIV